MLGASSSGGTLYKVSALRPACGPMEGQSTTPSAAYPGYGYLWWLGNAGAYRAIGIFGQGICVHSGQNVVVALHSARAVASSDEDWALQEALCDALAVALVSLPRPL